MAVLDQAGAKALDAHRPASLRFLTLIAAFSMLPVLSGCEPAGRPDLRQEIIRLGNSLQERDNQLVAMQATVDELEHQLTAARGISEQDMQRLFYPAELRIDALSGGADYDGQPGDDGVTVYLRPIDADGDVIKVPGDVKIELYDLEAPSGEKLLGEYSINVDEIGKLWHGRFATGHFTIKCPWLRGPPEHTEITIRAVFVDYLTKRVVSAQTVCKVKLPPGS